MSKKKLNVKCPNCNKSFSYYNSEFRPFCCEKCKMIDMGQWMAEAYSIEGRTNSVFIEEPELLKKLIDDTNENY